MRIGIIGAMEIEVSAIIEKMEMESEECVSGIAFAIGRLHGIEAVAAKCGIGKVNAGICAQIMIGSFGATHVINTGVAGSLSESIGIGDFVISSGAVYHDFSLENFGYAAGQVPGFDSAVFNADDRLAHVMERAIRLRAPDAAIHAGIVASGDRFICDCDDRLGISLRTGACCCEMEGAAVAQACRMNGVPFAIIRAISDMADGSSPEDYDAFERSAAESSSAAVLEAFRLMGGYC